MAMENNNNNNDNEIRLTLQKGVSLRFDKEQAVMAVIKTAFAAVGSIDLNKQAVSHAINSVKWQRSLERQAFELVFRSLVRAYKEQFADRSRFLYQENHWVDKLLPQLNKGEYTLNLKHFDEPHSLPLLSDFIAAYQKIIPSTSDDIIQHQQAAFKYYFAIAFFNELKEGQDNQYQTLLKEVNDPFNEKKAVERNRLFYQKQIEGLYRRPVLGEDDVALSNVYVELGFKVYHKYLSEKQRDIPLPITL